MRDKSHVLFTLLSSGINKKKSCQQTNKSYYSELWELSSTQSGPDLCFCASFFPPRGRGLSCVTWVPTHAGCRLALRGPTYQMPRGSYQSLRIWDFVTHSCPSDNPSRRHVARTGTRECVCVFVWISPTPR